MVPASQRVASPRQWLQPSSRTFSCCCSFFFLLNAGFLLVFTLVGSGFIATSAGRDVLGWEPFRGRRIAVAGAGHPSGPGPRQGAVSMGLSPSPETPSSVFRVGKTSQGGNDTLWESNLQSQIPALLVLAQGWGLTVSDTVPVLQGRGLRQGTLLRVGDRDLGSPCSSMGLGCPQHPWGCGSFYASTHQSLFPRVQSLGEDTRDKWGPPRRTLPGSRPVLPRDPCDTQGGGRQKWRRRRPPPCSSL